MLLKAIFVAASRKRRKVRRLPTHTTESIADPGKHVTCPVASEATCGTCHDNDNTQDTIP